MNPTPLRVFAVPRYPTKLQALSSPELLQEALPAGWKRSEALSAVAGVALLAQAACGSLGDEVGFARTSLVAPVSQHGEGVAGVGCVVISPPVFLSEEEALKVIREEAARRGLELTAPRSPVLGSSVVVSRGVDDDGKVESEPFVPDLADLRRHVAVEYVGRDDADRHGVERQEDGSVVVSSAWGIETRRSARELATLVNRTGTTGVWFGAFYDPAGHADCGRWGRSGQRKDCATAEKDKLAENKELLRAQVVDFLDWLRAQGAL